MVDALNVPYDTDAEEAVLGSILIEPQVMVALAVFLRPGDFFREHNGWIYAAALSLYAQRVPADIITVGAELERTGHGSGDGVGLAYLTHLITSAPVSSHAEHYGRIVEGLAVKRRLIQAGQAISYLGYDSSPDLDELLASAQGVLAGAASRQSDREKATIGSVLDDYLAKLEAGAAGLTGLPTGYADLDRMLSGLHPGDLSIIAARPGAGKTALMLNVAHHAAVKNGAPVALFSLEMSAEQLCHRLICLDGNLDSQLLRLNKLPEWKQGTFAQAVEHLAGAPIYIEDMPSLSMTALRNRARQLHTEEGIKLICIDYLQLMSASAENRLQEVSLLSRGLKSLARELEVPVLALSQLSRAVEQRPDHVPKLSDLRESGTIEQDADVVMFIYREEMYKNVTEPGITELNVAKHRNGPTGVVRLKFFNHSMKFTNLAEPSWYTAPKEDEYENE